MAQDEERAFQNPETIVTTRSFVWGRLHVSQSAERLYGLEPIVHSDEPERDATGIEDMPDLTLWVLAPNEMPPADSDHLGSKEIDLSSPRLPKSVRAHALVNPENGSVEIALSMDESFEAAKANSAQGLKIRAEDIAGFSEKLKAAKGIDYETLVSELGHMEVNGILMSVLYKAVGKTTHEYLGATQHDGSPEQPASSSRPGFLRRKLGGVSAGGKLSKKKASSKADLIERSKRFCTRVQTDIQRLYISDMAAFIERMTAGTDEGKEALRRLS